MSAPLPLPKPASGAWKECWEGVLALLDIPRSILVIEGALERKVLEELVQKLTRGQGRLAQVARGELVGRLADLFARQSDAAYAIAKELDRASHKERFIVASIEESSVEERIGTYRAIDFRRERARLVWALARDGRAPHKKAADAILKEAFAQMDKSVRLEEAAAAAAGAAGAPSGADPLQPASTDVHNVVTQMRERLKSYEDAIQEQQQAIKESASAQQQFEKERSELLARIGQRERALRDEEVVRRNLEGELARARAAQREAEKRLEDAETLLDSGAREELVRLRERAQQLEQKAARAREYAASLATPAERIDALERALADTERDGKRERDRLERELADVTRELEGERVRTAGLRDELRLARLALVQGNAPVPPMREPRIGVFVDAANLSASARREFGSKLDYRAVLEHVLEGRKRAIAIAYVVKDGDHYAGFARSLRDAGYDLREKTPKVRADGTKKADWDMGIAMEILDAQDELDVVILCSGDGDYLPLVKRLQRERKRVEVASFRSATDELLIKAADAFFPLDGRFRLAQ